MQKGECPSARMAIVRAHRPRGIYVPALDVPLHLANGWKLLDDCPGGEDVLLAPPVRELGRAA